MYIYIAGIVIIKIIQVMLYKNMYDKLRDILLTYPMLHQEPDDIFIPEIRCGK